MYAAGASQEHMAGVIQEHVAGVIQEHVDCSHNVATRTPAKTGMENEHQKSIAIKASPYESEIHPSHKSDDLCSVYFASRGGAFRRW